MTSVWILTAPHLGVPVEDLAEGGDQLGRVAHEVEQHDGHGHPGQPHLPPPQRVVARPGQHTMSGDWRLKYLLVDLASEHEFLNCLIVSCLKYLTLRQVT